MILRRFARFPLVALLLLALFGAGLAPRAAQAAGENVGAEPQTSLADLEDEVMCPVCGTLLGLSEAPQAERERVLIRRLIDEGLTKEEIKDRLVAEYGPQVLALPESSGFSLTAYIAPVAGFLIAAVALFLAVRRWRRDTESEAAASPEDGAELSESETERLDSDLARYDL